jgi:hypothetical protein
MGRSFFVLIFDLTFKVQNYVKPERNDNNKR